MFLENANEQVVLVDNNDQTVGLMDKLEAHQKGLLHRAISIWIEDSQGRVLLQQRAATKYHSPNLWANACCSHPRENEPLQSAAARRLKEELGICCPLKQHSSFIYRASVGLGLIEHEFDHLFFGVYEGPFSINAHEVSAVQWVDRGWLQQALLQQKTMFAAWLPYVFSEIATTT
jgi:isopentenyl-diphosphate Delta-isomerase